VLAGQACFRRLLTMIFNHDRPPGHGAAACRG
jgi:hypothetical protein